MTSFAPRVRYSIATIITMCATLSSLPMAGASECVATSGAQRVATLELYTSEGCDSCPSADRWVSELAARKLTSERVIPLAFHVDYWNQLGWIDPYAQAVFSERQRRHSNRRGVSFVVTPQLLLNGQDYRRGILFDDFAGRVKAINQSKARADIRAGVSSSNTMLVGKIAVSVAGGSDPRHAQVYLALYENNLVSAVNAGENKGQILKHDFVVRSLIGPLGLDDTGNLSHVQRFAFDTRWKPQDVHLAVFVQDPHSGDVLQALVADCR